MLFNIQIFLLLGKTRSLPNKILHVFYDLTWMYVIYLPGDHL